MLNDIILSFVLFLPLIAGIVALFIPSKFSNSIKWFTLDISIINFIFSLIIFKNFNTNSFFQYVVNVSWIKELGISYFIGIDGISLFLLLITTFFIPVAILSSWNIIKKHEKAFYISILFLEFSLIGATISLNMFLFYIFWEIMLIPMFFIIGIWGGPKRIKANIKFVVYTMIGSLAMLFSLLYLYISHYKQYGYYSFNLMDLYMVNIEPQYAAILFFTFLIAFAIKAPLFPFHTWLPDTYSEAPISGTLILSAVMAKLGVYGMIRFVIPIFPNTFLEYSNLLMTLAIIGTIYCGLIAFAQKDLKRLIAYSSISHLGYIVLGVFAFNIQSLQGSVFHMVGHALSTGTLFLMVSFLEERVKTRDMTKVTGLMKKIPIFGTFFMLIMLSSIGLPGLNGFVGELLIFLGVFGKSPIFSALGTTGIIIGAIYMLWMFQKVMFGTENSKLKINDLKTNEILLLIPISTLIILLGVYPNIFLDKMEPTIERYVDIFEGKTSNNNTLGKTDTNHRFVFLK